MTLEEFFMALATTQPPRWKFWKPRWRINAMGEVRRGHYPQDCPISAVTGHQPDFTNPKKAGIEKLHMTASLAWKLWGAADHVGRVLRPEMLATLGLHERLGETP